MNAETFNIQQRTWHVCIIKCNSVVAIVALHVKRLHFFLLSFGFWNVSYLRQHSTFHMATYRISTCNYYWRYPEKQRKEEKNVQIFFFSSGAKPAGNHMNKRMYGTEAHHWKIK